MVLVKLLERHLKNFSDSPFREFLRDNVIIARHFRGIGFKALK